jgi:D-aspartate ligase
MKPMIKPRPDSPPLIILGGGANALSVARSLGSRGVRVYAINLPTEHVRYSRYCRWIPLSIHGSPEQCWTDFLLGPRSDYLRGSVLLSGSDAGLTILANHQDELAKKFLLDESNPAAQRAMLDKRSTYECARAAGVETPRFWLPKSLDDVVAARNELVFPLIVKPLISHLFERRFGKKFVVADDFDELLAAYQRIVAAGVDVMLVERIPGPDDRLCSYYTYLDASGEPLFDFTKRIIRRYPASMGAACYHITDHNPLLKEIALRLFRHAGLRGLANVEFKRDDRDGRLKLIECNARFTAANCLVAASGFDLALFVYNRLTGQESPRLVAYRDGVRLWYPAEDFKSFLELRARGELTFGRWLRSLLHSQTFPFFSLRDPGPTLAIEFGRAGRKLLRGVRALGRAGRRLVGFAVDGGGTVATGSTRT